ncbi:hypothetical protein U9M48_044801 [Paspalum notatum var. saurae]|uniref:Uncharacterized protein n=1 Tax=Paspalum notatum var. saurae TaxID=547442 RepID=A0AAQ3XIX6_PASNO
MPPCPWHHATCLHRPWPMAGSRCTAQSRQGHGRRGDGGQPAPGDGMEPWVMEGAKWQGNGGRSAVYCGFVAALCRRVVRTLAVNGWCREYSAAAQGPARPTPCMHACRQHATPVHSLDGGGGLGHGTDGWTETTDRMEAAGRRGRPAASHRPPGLGARSSSPSCCYAILLWSWRAPCVLVVLLIPEPEGTSKKTIISACCCC